MCEYVAAGFESLTPRYMFSGDRRMPTRSLPMASHKPRTTSRVSLHRFATLPPYSSARELEESHVNWQRRSAHEF